MSKEVVTTKQAKEMVKAALAGQLASGAIEKALAFLADDDPKAFLDACAKLFPYVMPKQVSMEVDVKEIKQPSWFGDVDDAEVIE